jgi:hypothetical protein
MATAGCTNVLDLVVGFVEVWTVFLDPPFYVFSIPDGAHAEGGVWLGEVAAGDQPLRPLA